jgi:hypothetical protein
MRGMLDIRFLGVSARKVRDSPLLALNDFEVCGVLVLFRSFSQMMNATKRVTSVLRVLAVAAGHVCLLAGLSAQAGAFEPVSVPEIDPGSMASALMLLSGGLLILTGRRGRK